VDRRAAQLNGLYRVPGLAADLLKAPELIPPLHNHITSDRLNSLAQSLGGSAAHAAV
jgi:hypothetical protein